EGVSTVHSYNLFSIARAVAPPQPPRGIDAHPSAGLVYEVHLRQRLDGRSRAYALLGGKAGESRRGFSDLSGQYHPPGFRSGRAPLPSSLAAHRAGGGQGGQSLSSQTPRSAGYALPDGRPSLSRETESCRTRTPHSWATAPREDQSDYL